MTLETIGEGKYFVEFSWNGGYNVYDEKIITVKHKSKDRAGIAKTLRNFKRATEELRRELKNNSIDECIKGEMKSRKPITFKWLAAQKPTVKIFYPDKEGNGKTKKYKFDYRFLGFVTWRTYQRVLQKEINRVSIFFK